MASTARPAPRASSTISPAKRARTLDDHWHRIDEAESAHVRGERRPWCLHGGHANDPDTNRAGADDRVIANPRNVATIRVFDVGAEDRVASLVHASAERV